MWWMKCCRNTWVWSSWGIGTVLNVPLTWTSYNKILFWPKSPPRVCVCLKWARIWIAPKIYLRCFFCPPVKKNGLLPICFQIHVTTSLRSLQRWNSIFDKRTLLYFLARKMVTVSRLLLPRWVNLKQIRGAIFHPHLLWRVCQQKLLSKGHF